TTGITDYEAKIRLGKQQVVDNSQISFLQQLRTVLTILLFVLSVYFILIGYFLETGIILAFILSYIFLNLFKSKKIDKQTSLIKNSNMLKIQAIRNGEKKQVSFDQIVPGDIIFIKKGDVVPVHCRILNQSNVSVDESIIKGDKTPVHKTDNSLDSIQLPEINNVLFPKSIVLSGSCTAIAIHECKEAEIDYSLFFPQKINKILGTSIIIIAATSIAIGYLIGLELRTLFISAFSLAVTFLPEAFYYRKLSSSLENKLLENEVIIRTPGIADSLESVSVLCINKKSLVDEMSVKKIHINDMLVDINGSKFIYQGRQINPKRFEDIQLLLASGQLCNNFGVNGNKNPVDEALLSLSISAGLSDLRTNYKRTKEYEFDSEKRIMSVAYSIKNKDVLYAKGAINEILRRCSFIYDAGGIRRIRAVDVRKIIDITNSMEKQGLEVIAFATKKRLIENEKDLTFIGVQAIKLNIRSDLGQLINDCKNLGTKIFFITGAKKDLVENISYSIGLSGKIVTGYEIDKSTNVQLDEYLEKINVYSSISQKQKQKIIERLRENGNKLAVVGSDLSDISSMKIADVKISLENSDNIVKSESDITSKDPFTPIIIARKEQ
ncbi:MAG: cation-transporting P-type ATPase, partial [Candidatus Aenigmarchaeota archaeon]|nr:cation-transporting P-type ATPase [Candidatus Aenigmarchaeota archaeon]